MHICTLQCFQWRKPRHFPAPQSKYSQVQEVNFNFFSALYGEGDTRGGRGGGLCRGHKRCHVCIFSSWFCHTWNRSMEKLSFILSEEQWSPASRRTKMETIPDLVLKCLAVSYNEFRSLEWWQKKDSRGEGREGHTLIVMVGEYWGDRRHVTSCWAQRCKTVVKETYVLALKGVEEVSTQLPIIPRGPRGIADAT